MVLEHGELPPGRHRWQFTRNKGRGKGKWAFHDDIVAEWPYRADYVSATSTLDATSTRTLDATGTRSHSAPPKPSRPSAGSSSSLPGKETAEDDKALSMPEGLFGHWLNRGGQENWRIMAVHVDRKHAYLRQEECRFTCGDLITLGLRDHTDNITGNWNQASNYLEECCYYAVRTYES